MTSLPQDLEIAPATVDDYAEAHAFILEHFIPNVHVCQTIGFTAKDEPAPLTEFMIRNSLESGLSIKCKEKESGQVVGYRLSAVRIMGEDNELPKMTFGWKESALKQLMVAFLKNLEELLPDAKKILEFEMLAVKDTHHRKGIAEALLAKNMQMGKDAGCDHVIVVASVARSQSLFRKLGFDNLREIQYADFLVDGIPMFVGEDGFGTKSCILFAKKL